MAIGEDIYCGFYFLN